MKPQIEIRVEEGDVFKDVTNNALKIEPKLNAVPDLRKGTFNKQEPDENRNKYKINYTTGEIRVSQLCNKGGHTALSCQTLGRFNQYIPRPPYTTPEHFLLSQNRKFQNPWGNRISPHVRSQWAPSPQQDDQGQFRHGNKEPWIPQQPQNIQNSPF